MTDASDQLVQLVFRGEPAEALDEVRLRLVTGGWNALHPQLGLTGLMIRFGTTFVGVVEGPRAAVLARLETMSSDSILSGLAVLREAEIERRRFATWRFQDLSTRDGDDALRASGDLFAHQLSQQLYKGS